jgi:CspA family cold shock protein
MRAAQHVPGGRGNDRMKETRDMPNGTVKWFNTTKGYGFIAPDDGGKDVFVHISAVERSGLTGLADNQKLSYELQEGRDGRQMAADLKLL